MDSDALQLNELFFIAFRVILLSYCLPCEIIYQVKPSLFHDCAERGMRRQIEDVLRDHVIPQVFIRLNPVVEIRHSMHQQSAYGIQSFRVLALE